MCINNGRLVDGFESLESEKRIRKRVLVESALRAQYRTSKLEQLTSSGYNSIWLAAA